MEIKDKKILLTGGRGFLGTFVYKHLLLAGANKENIFIPDSKKNNLVDLENCKKAVKGIDVVIHLAAKVGGIGLNQVKPGELFYENLMMGVQLMEEARKAQVKKFVAVGTVCAYPKFTPVPFKESDLWNGYPEETNAAYGIAKKVLLVQSQAYRQQYDFNSIYLLPVNLYGPNDNFELESSHVIPALIRKFVEAKEQQKDSVEIWGTGKASREFLYVDDAARAIVAATINYDLPEPINIGSGSEISILDLVEKIKNIMEYKGKIVWNTSKPDGQPRRCLDTSKAFENFGFRAETDFDAGLRQTIDWYLSKKK